MSVHPFQPAAETIAPPSADNSSLPAWPSLRPEHSSRLNNLIQRFLTLAQRSPRAATAVLAIGDAVLRGYNA